MEEVRGTMDEDTIDCFLEDMFSDMLKSRSSYRDTKLEVKREGGYVLIHVLFRRSNIWRRKYGNGNDANLRDFDIVQIEVEPAGEGHGTWFFEKLVSAAAKFDRGVFLEQTITDASRAWASKLVNKHMLMPYAMSDTYVLEDNFLSVFR